MSRAEYWMQTERHIGLALRFLYVFMALWLVQQDARALLKAADAPVWLGYVLLATLSIPIALFLRPSQSSDVWIALSQVVDGGFLAYTVFRSTTAVGPAAWLFTFWIARQVLLASAWPMWYGVAFLSGPFYLIPLYARAGSWNFVFDRNVQMSYALLLVMTLGGWALARHLYGLRSALAHERRDLAHKTEILQRTASDLGARVLELRALQDVAHHLSISLHLEQTLDVIGQRARELFDVPHVAVLLISEDSQTWRWGYVDGRADASDLPPLPPAPTGLLSHIHTIPADASHSSDQSLALTFHHLWGENTLILVPLIARGRQVALLILGTPRAANAFGERQSQLAESFAFLAATAIENARLYESVLEQRQELEAVLQSIGDAVIVSDARLHVLLVNPIAKRTLRMPPAAEGKHLAQVVENEALVQLVQDVFKGAKSVLTRDITFAFPGEKPRTFQAVASAVMGRGQSARAVVTVLRDVTAQKELERMKSNFISVVSHELKTPLHSIKGFVEIIRMGKAGPITDLQADFLTTVKEQTQVLQRMIDDLLVFSRLETGQLKLHVEEISLAAIAANVVQKLTPLAEEKSITLENRLPESFPEVEGDYMRLEQVLTNLVENAIKFTPAGGQVIVDGQDLGERVRVWVQDTGIGIPKSEQERIFDRFYQVDASERRAHRGTGLGLTICKHIVERHHGHIWVESEVGQGSTFFVELPKKLPPTTEALDFYTGTEEASSREALRRNEIPPAT